MVAEGVAGGRGHRGVCKWQQHRRRMGARAVRYSVLLSVCGMLGPCVLAYTAAAAAATPLAVLCIAHCQPCQEGARGC